MKILIPNLMLFGTGILLYFLKKRRKTNEQDLPHTESDPSKNYLEGPKACMCGYYDHTYRNLLQRRYFDMKRWITMSRPQYKYSCGISSLTSTFNFLYSKLGHGELEPLTQEDVMRILGFGEPFSEIRFGPFTGNATIMKWFYKIIQHFNKKGRAYFLWKGHGYGKTIGLTNEGAQEMVKEALRNPHCSLIYHCYNHYMVPIGYDEIPSDPHQAYSHSVHDSDMIMQVLIGDNSKTSRSIHCVKFKDIYTDITIQNPYYFNIRHPELGVQKRKSKKVGGNIHCIMAFRNDLDCPAVDEVPDEDEKQLEAISSIPVHIYEPRKRSLSAT